MRHAKLQPCVFARHPTARVIFLNPNGVIVVVDGGSSRREGSTNDSSLLPPSPPLLPLLLHVVFSPCWSQEERRRLHAEMAKMQSLEEEALLKGTLAVRNLGGRSSTSPNSPSSSTATLPGNPSRRSGGPRSKEDGEEPQTDGDETDDYSDQVRTPNGNVGGGSASLFQAAHRVSPTSHTPRDSYRNLN